jgi:hypothetical protein
VNRPALLRARKDALERLLATSVEIRTALESPDSGSRSGQNIDELLERREQECRSFAALCQENGDIREPHSDDAGGRPSDLATSLDRDIQQLSEQILACQSECQAIMRARLDALAGAIRESVQRRKVESAYGPASSPLNPVQGLPVFLDRQQ